MDWEEIACDINTEDGVSVVDDAKGTRPRRFFRVLQELGDLDQEELARFPVVPVDSGFARQIKGPTLDLAAGTRVIFPGAGRR